MRSSSDETRRHPCAAVESRFCCAFPSAVALGVRRGRSVIALGSLLHAECSWSTGVVTAKILQDSTAAGFCIDGSHNIWFWKRANAGSGRTMIACSQLWSLPCMYHDFGISSRQYHPNGFFSTSFRIQAPALRLQTRGRKVHSRFMFLLG